MNAVEQVMHAVAKLEGLATHHPSIVMASEAKMLYKTIPVLIKLLNLAIPSWEPLYPEEFEETYAEWVELAQIINEEKDA